MMKAAVDGTVLAERASYFHVLVDGWQLPDAAWTYHRPWLSARRLEDHVAFWRGVEVE